MGLPKLGLNELGHEIEEMGLLELGENEEKAGKLTSKLVVVEVVAIDRDYEITLSLP